MVRSRRIPLFSTYWQTIPLDRLQGLLYVIYDWKSATVAPLLHVKRNVLPLWSLLLEWLTPRWQRSISRYLLLKSTVFCSWSALRNSRLLDSYTLYEWLRSFVCSHSPHLSMVVCWAGLSRSTLPKLCYFGRRCRHRWWRGSHGYLGLSISWSKSRVSHSGAADFASMFKGS